MASMDRAYVAVMRDLAAEALSGLSREELLKHLHEKSKKEGLSRIPSIAEVIRFLPWQDRPAESRQVIDMLRIKPVRMESGIHTVAVMLPPRGCSHGGCSYCPGGPGSVYGDVPQSYTGNEPASMRAKRLGYDAYLQVYARLSQYASIGHEPVKLDVIVMGGTFFDYPKTVREAFIRDIYLAVNRFAREYYQNGRLDYHTFFIRHTWARHDTRAFIKHALHLKQEETTDIRKAQVENMRAAVRIIGLSIETRPETITPERVQELRRLGVTRVELGVQHVKDSILLANGRPHTHEDTIQATRILRQAGFKLVYHMMPGLPESSLEDDLAALKELYTDSRLRPDMLKIYPTMVFPGTRLYDWYVEGRYTPLREEDLIHMLARFKAWLPVYVRIMRLQRDIPPQLAVAGVRISNLRQKVQEALTRHGEQCRCIRCRQAKRAARVAYTVRTYPLAPGREFFISAESAEGIHGFLRLNMQNDTAFVRELHVYGPVLRLAEKKTHAVQHQGIGKSLLSIAEAISYEHGIKRIRVISGIGVREYYARQGYSLQEEDMVKQLLKQPASVPAWQDATPRHDPRYA